MLYRTENTSEIARSALKSLSVRFRVFVNILLLLAYSLVKAAPLRIVADGNSGRKGIVKSGFFDSLCTPSTNIKKVIRVVGAS